MIPCLFLVAGLLAFQAPPSPNEPAEPRGLRLSAPGAFPGYTLLAPLASRHTFLVDLEGREVHRWTSELPPSATHLLADGSILRCARVEGNKVFNGGGICGRIERIGWDGELLWKYDLANEDQMSHHDACAMPNGNVLVITWEFRYREDCLAAGRDPGHTTDRGLWPDAVLEVKPTPPEGGEIVWEWHAWDHLVQDVDPAADNHGAIADHPELLDVNYDHRDERPMTEEERRKKEELEAEMRALGYTGGAEEEEETPPAPQAPVGFGGMPLGGSGPDWLHTNAIDYNPELDLIVLSSPNLSEIWIIDHSTTTDQAAGHTGGRHGKGGDILWRWGNPENYGAGTDADRRLFFQHNVHWIPPGAPGAGHLLVFNNGQERPGGEYSSVDELALPLEPGKGFVRAGRAHGPAEPVWSYHDKANFYASFISGCQRLPNGNTLICDGPQGRLFEVTSAGAVVWEFWSPFGGDLKADGVGGHALFRATRVASDHPALKGRTLVPVEASGQ
jgi:hypothetical protein